jgi:hypothetical protein
MLQALLHLIQLRFQVWQLKAASLRLLLFDDGLKMALEMLLSEGSCHQLILRFLCGTFIGLNCLRICSDRLHLSLVLY